MDVCLYAKIRILKQITTTFNYEQLFKRCLSLCKDTNFKANHNNMQILLHKFYDVCLYAKIRILKQITTGNELQHKNEGMFVSMQRYEF